MAEPRMITGIVTDPSGRPVPGAVVAIQTAPVPVPDIAALTGADGRFSIPAPVSGAYRLVVRGERSVREVAVTVGDSGAEATVQLVD